MVGDHDARDEGEGARFAGVEDGLDALEDDGAIPVFG